MPLPSPNNFFAKIKGLLTTNLRVGTATDQFIEFRNNADTDFANVRGKDPVNQADFVTLGYYEGQEGSNVQSLAYTIVENGTTTQSSVFQIPGSAVITRTVVAITSPFTEVSQTIKVGYTGSVDKLVAATDVDVTLAWQNDFPAIVEWDTTPKSVLTTLNTAGTGTGTATIYVFFYTIAKP